MRNRILFAVLIAAAMWIAGRPLRLETTVLRAATGNPGPYDAIIDRVAQPKRATAAPAAAGSRFTDPIFGPRMRCVTDPSTRPASLCVSYRTPSGSHQNAWSKNGNYFYMVSLDGSVVPLAFDRTSMTTSWINQAAGRGVQGRHGRVGCACFEGVAGGRGHQYRSVSPNSSNFITVELITKSLPARLKADHSSRCDARISGVINPTFT